MEILLIRHALSETNAGLKWPHLDGDHDIPLAPRGRKQAIELAQSLPKTLLQESLIYCSPFRRARETLQLLLQAHDLDDLTVREDPLLREQDCGYELDIEQNERREIHGRFWYRQSGGESPADCYQRVSVFLSVLHRHMEGRAIKRAVIISHNMTIRCFVMRFLNLPVDDFDRIGNPGNCTVIRIARKHAIDNADLVHRDWSVAGLPIKRRLG